MAAIVKKLQQQGKDAAEAETEAEEGMPEPVIVAPDPETWSADRVFLFHMIHSHKFEAFCATVILFNMLLVILETDQSADDGTPEGWIGGMTHVLLAFYTCELGTKMYILRKAFVYDPWNVLDLCIVGVDLILLMVSFVVSNMPSVAILRVFRLVRLARAFKAAKQFRELNALIRSFGFAMKAIFWGILMIVMILAIWSILAVQLIHPINVRIAETTTIYEGCERCPRAFSTVFESCLTFWQQVVAGDSWGTVCLPIVHEAPWTMVFFLMVLVTVNLTMLNLILAVIVEAGARANEEDMHDKAMQIQKKIIQAEKRLIQLCSSLDVDQSGSLNIEEFLKGFENNKEFAECLQTMNVTKSDINMIFNICDEDGSGDVNYVEFVDQLRRIRKQGEQMLLYYVTEIRHKVQQLKLRLLDKVTTAFENLPDACETDKVDSVHVEYSSEEARQAAESAGSSPTLGTGQAAAQAQLLAHIDDSHRILPDRVSTDTSQASNQNGRDGPLACSGKEPEVEPMLLQPASASDRRLPPEPRLPAPPEFSSQRFDEILATANSQDTTASVTIPSRRKMENGALGGNSSEQLDHLLQVNQRIIAVIEDVVLESKLHTGILNTLAERIPSWSAPAPRPREPICVPVLSLRSAEQRTAVFAREGTVPLERESTGCCTSKPAEPVRIV